MPLDAAARQSRLTKLTWDAFRERDAVLAFLNGHHPRLAGRPLDLAIGSEAGLASIEAVLLERRLIP